MMLISWLAGPPVADQVGLNTSAAESVRRLPFWPSVDYYGRGYRPDAAERDYRKRLACAQVRPPTTWTILKNYGPNHIGLW